MDPPRQPTSSTEPTQTQPVRLDYISATASAGVLWQREPGRLLIHLPPPPMWALLAPRIVCLAVLTSVATLVIALVLMGLTHYLYSIEIEMGIVLIPLAIMAAIAWGAIFRGLLTFGRFGRLPVSIFVDDDALRIDHLTPWEYRSQVWRRSEIADISVHSEPVCPKSDMLYIVIRFRAEPAIELALRTRAPEVAEPLEAELRQALKLPPRNDRPDTAAMA